MTPYTDTQLKQTLAKMLPANKVEKRFGYFYWLNSGGYFDNPEEGTGQYPDREVLDTELLHLCWLVEETLFNEPRREYINELVNNHPLRYHPASASDTNMAVYFQVHATWQQRVKALAAVKCVEICSSTI